MHDKVMGADEADEEFDTTEFPALDPPDEGRRQLQYNRRRK